MRHFVHALGGIPCHFPARLRIPADSAARPQETKGVNDVERTVSAMVKLTQENDESWVYVVDYGMVPLLRGQPTAVCQLIVLPSRKQLVTQLRPVQGGAEDTEERVLSMVYGISLGQLEAGFLVKSMRSIPTNMVGQTCERVSHCCGSHVKRVLARRQDTVTLNEEQGAVLRGGRTRRRTTFSVLSVVAKVKLAMEVHAQ